MRATDIAEGITNYVVNWAKVKKGENIVIVPDSLANPMVVDLIAYTARQQGANVVVSWIDYNPRQTQGGGPIISSGLRGADKVLRMNFALSHDRGTTSAIQDHGVTMYAVANPTPEFFASEAARFPVDLTLAILKKTLQKVWATKYSTVRVSDKRGTDVTAKGFACDWGGDFQNSAFKWDVMGVYPRTFPGAITGLVPPMEGNGVAYFDAYSGIGLCPNLLKVTYQDGRLVHAEGGIEAEKLKQMLKGIPGANVHCEIMFGLNPKVRSNAPVDQKPIPNEAERRAGTLHMGTGNRPMWGAVWEAMKDVPKPYRDSHLDGFILKPTVHVNGEPIIEDGHLLILEDPEVREFAKKFGDPDELLKEAGPA